MNVDSVDANRAQHVAETDETEGREVSILYKTLPHYRVNFFDRLRSRLSESGVTLRLLVGQPDNVAAQRRDTAPLGWAQYRHNRHITLGKRTLIWQPVVRDVLSSDLVIVEQANKLLVNYVLTALRGFGGPRLALWGHGKNMDPATASRVSECVKRNLVTACDWWFCYTEGTARLVESLGVDPHRTTVVQNTTDTESLRRAREAMGPGEISTVRAALGIGDGPVAVSIGSIYPTKRPEFLINAADHLRRLVPGFELIVIGDGPDRHLLDDATSSRPWLHVLGAILGAELARWASPASVLLNPGLVGLTVVDAFALGLPMITCDLPYHSPEIEYLQDGVNGVILPEGATAQEYAGEVARLLNNHHRLAYLSCNAVEAAGRYTMDEMVERFTDGILAALQAPRADAYAGQTIRRR